jgi:transcriptional regulator with XRE-family HTH domain
MKPRSPPPSASPRTKTRPGALLKKLRIQKGLTLKEVSERTGYPVSTLSKIENDRVSLTYDKLTRISAGLEVDFSSLFGAEEDPAALHGRRAITRSGEGRPIESKNYFHLYPATELLHKRLIPIIVEIRARSIEEFGELVRHTGEEYLYVLEGEIDVFTSTYAPARLNTGDSIYVDSTMGHAYVAASNRPCRVLCVCSGSESQMISAIGGTLSQSASPPPSEAPTARPKRAQRRRGAA